MWVTISVAIIPQPQPARPHPPSALACILRLPVQLGPIVVYSGPAVSQVHKSNQDSMPWVPPTHPPSGRDTLLVGVGSSPSPPPLSALPRHLGACSPVRRMQAHVFGATFARTTPHFARYVQLGTSLACAFTFAATALPPARTTISTPRSTLPPSLAFTRHTTTPQHLPRQIPFRTLAVFPYCPIIRLVPHLLPQQESNGKTDSADGVYWAFFFDTGAGFHQSIHFPITASAFLLLFVLFHRSAFDNDRRVQTERALLRFRSGTGGVAQAPHVPRRLLLEIYFFLLCSDIHTLKARIEFFTHIFSSAWTGSFLLLPHSPEEMQYESSSIIQFLSKSNPLPQRPQFPGEFVPSTGCLACLAGLLRSSPPSCRTSVRCHARPDSVGTKSPSNLHLAPNKAIRWLIWLLRKEVNICRKAMVARKITQQGSTCQLGARPSPLDRAIATSAAASITHDSGFHMNDRNSVWRAQHSTHLQERRPPRSYLQKRSLLLLLELIQAKQTLCSTPTWTEFWPADPEFWPADPEYGKVWPALWSSA
ncbi:hypothetical protein K438DRAFT_1768159 [Mycena galopus ATCC 62051]|nr:hypothetical protein K438DRAFT_1768159 [Mycena galopus ATCC 62051]